MKKKNTISVSEIKRQLAALKEEVAAPRDFRASIMKRLAQETGQAAPEAQASLWRRLLDFASQPGLAPALGAAAMVAVFGLWLGLRPAQPAARQSAVASVAAPRPAQMAALKPSQRAAVMAKARPAQQAASQAAPVAAAEMASAQPAAAALGSDPGAGSSSQTKFSAQPAGGLSGAGNPTATPGSSNAGGKPLEGNSQVRRNRFQASRGEYAAILFKLSAPGHARVEIFDRVGRRLAVLHDADEGVGSFELRWYGQEDNGQLAPSGIYLVRIVTAEYNASHKIVLVR